MTTTSVRLAGWALIIGNIITLITGFLHPVVGFHAEAHASTDQFLNPRWFAVHAFVLITFPLILWGFWGLFEQIREKKERIFAVPALITMGIYIILAFIEIIMDGFGNQALAKQYAAASPELKEVIFALFEHHFTMDNIFLGVAFTFFSISLVLYSASIIKTQLYKSWIGWLGIAIGLIGIVAYAFGFMGHYWIDGSGFLIYASAFTLWSIIIGLMMIKTKE